MEFDILTFSWTTIKRYIAMEVKMLMLYIPSRVRMNPVTRQNSLPSFQPNWKAATKSTGTP